jgi:hypothetical protein
MIPTLKKMYKNIPMAEKKSWTKVLIRLPKQLGLVNIFKEATRNFPFIFKRTLKKNDGACKETTDLILEAFKKYSSRDPVDVIFLSRLKEQRETD